MVEIDFSKYNVTDILSRSDNYDEVWLKQLLKFLEKWNDDERDDIRFLSSGTTGERKEILLKKSAMMRSAVRTCDFFSLQQGDSVLLCLSVDYIAGVMMVVRAIVRKLKLLIVKPSSNPLQELKKQVDLVAIVPLQLRTIVSDNSSLLNKSRVVLIGGGSISGIDRVKLSGVTTTLYATYGMTETITHVAVKEIHPNCKNLDYKTLKDVSISLDDRGCLVVKDPQTSVDAIVTNDVCEINSDRTFNFVGRIDNVINSGGVKIFPEEIELKLKPLFETEYYITSETDDNFGEIVVLVIEGAMSESKFMKLKSEMKSLLPIYAVAKKIIFLDKFKRTDSGKVIRKK